MSTPACPQCGLPLDPNSPEKPCPACLLELAALSGSFADTAPSLPAEPDLETVQKAFPQLEILAMIGRGGMGTVYKARQAKLNRFVAVKILSEKLAEKPGFAERFAQEGKMLALLNHPNIVAVYDFGQADNFFYLILEYVDGVNLRQAMREEKFTPEQAFAVVPKICDALQYAHDEGVLHRDIKPENILIDTKGRVKIVDFGLGRFYTSTNLKNEPGPVVTDSVSAAHGSLTNELTQTGQILGTPNYMAPEQHDAPNNVDHRADIYSLGVVLYEMLTGELPQKPLSPPSEKTSVGANVDEIVLKAMNRNREQRFQSAVEMKTEIESAKMPQHTGDSSSTPGSKDRLEIKIALSVSRFFPSILHGVTILFFLFVFSYFGYYGWIFNREVYKSEGLTTINVNLTLAYFFMLFVVIGMYYGFYRSWRNSKRAARLQSLVETKTEIESATANRLTDSSENKAYSLSGILSSWKNLCKTLERKVPVFVWVLLFLFVGVMVVWENAENPNPTLYILIILMWCGAVCLRWILSYFHPKNNMDSPTSPPNRKLAVWGCGLLLASIFASFFTMHLWLTPQSVSFVNEKVSDNGKVVQMTLEEAKESIQPTTLSISLGIALLGASFLLPILGTWFGWRHLRNIRKTPEKPGWLLGMIAALLLPLFLLWLIPWGIGLLFGSYVAQVFDFPGQIMEFIGGTVAFFFSLCLIVLLIWKTYRWIFPRPKRIPGAARLAHWGLGISLTAFVMLMGIVPLMFLSRAGIQSAQYQVHKLELTGKKELADFETSIASLEKELQESNNEYQKKGLSWSINSLKTNRIQVEQRHVADVQIAEKRNQSLFVFINMFIIGYAILALLLAIIGTVFGWRHLARIRKTAEKPCIIPGLIAAFLIPGPILIAACIAIPAIIIGGPFTLGDWGTQQQFVPAVAFTIGGMLGIVLCVLVVRKVVRWVIAGWFPGTSTPTNSEMKTEIESAKMMSGEQPASQTMLTPQKEETAWRAFVNVPLWMYLFAGFVLFFVLPSLISTVIMIVQYANGDLTLKIADIFVRILPLMIFATAVWIMKHWRLPSKTAPKEKPLKKYANDIYPIIAIVAFGLVIPFIAGWIGSELNHFKPWFHGIQIGGLLFMSAFNLIAIGTAIFFYYASKQYPGILKYLAVMLGYGTLAGLYLPFDISSDAQAGIASIFFPIFSIPGFIVGYFTGAVVNYCTNLYQPTESNQTDSGSENLMQSIIDNKSLFLVRLFSGVLIMGLIIVSFLWPSVQLYGVGSKNKLEWQQWKSMSVEYYINDSNKRYVSRNVVIDKADLEFLNGLYVSKEVRFMSVANKERFLLKTHDGIEWQMDMRHPNKLLYCRKDNTKYAYVVTLANTDFYEKLREICLKNEKTITPNVKLENIVLCNGGIKNDIVEQYEPMDLPDNEQ